MQSTTKVVQAEPILGQQKKEFSGKKKHSNIAHHHLVVNEKNVILETLHNNNGIKSITDKELGISTSTLWRKLKQYKNEE